MRWWWWYGFYIALFDSWGPPRQSAWNLFLIQFPSGIKRFDSQVHSDLQPFIDLYRHPPGTPFDLTSAPVVLHLEELRKDTCPENSSRIILDYIKNPPTCVESCDFEMVRTGDFFLKVSFILQDFSWWGLSFIFSLSWILSFNASKGDRITSLKGIRPHLNLDTL